MILTKQNIDSLLALCQEGNRLAQLEVYNRYQHAMFNTSLRIVKDAAEAEDVMQESFITAFEKLSSFKGDASFGAWLKRIVVNNSISQYRKSQRFTSIPDHTFIEVEDDSTADGLPEEDYTSLKVSQLLSCVEQLHDSYREILTLHFIEGYDYEELCEILNISYANCRTLISRAKESLRKKILISYEY
ncbi:RNA polymerase sigma factor [Altibacter lentus]|uniref:RNA polymerase sigma factor n=1 Tax=Altibacter lentus TaxID=1223410 RepID=UPI0005535CF0|nr:RNA polymerase sigma factor [Altibacter lentus]